MKYKPIIADPLRLYQLGLRNLMDMAILIHIGRCGIVGAKRASIAALMNVAYETVRGGVDRLCELKLITSVSRDYRAGLPHNFVCTVGGWKLLTEPADFTMFPHSQLALLNHASLKKSSKNQPPEDQSPAANAAGIVVEAGGDDDHVADPAADSDTEREAAPLGRETPGDETGPGASEADDAVPADGQEAAGAAGILPAVSLADLAPAG